ncbi:hypothetical protein B0H11DRAFT_1930846 [Mycena galericulata]|nr:hypothetical protein B0H11DRAFT_1930846 [Mycena galericulata]
MPQFRQGNTFDSGEQRENSKQHVKRHNQNVKWLMEKHVNYLDLSYPLSTSAPTRWVALVWVWDADIIYNNSLGGHAAVLAMHWSGALANTTLAGKLIDVNNFPFACVYAAGHEAPAFQPAAALAIFEQIIAVKPLHFRQDLESNEWVGSMWYETEPLRSNAHRARCASAFTNSQGARAIGVYYNTESGTLRIQASSSDQTQSKSYFYQISSHWCCDLMGVANPDEGHQCFSLLAKNGNYRPSPCRSWGWPDQYTIPANGTARGLCDHACDSGENAIDDRIAGAVLKKKKKRGPTNVGRLVVPLRNSRPILSKFFLS